METIKVCWKEVSINLKKFAFLVSGGLWAHPAMLLPEKHYLMIFFLLCVCVSDFVWVEHIKYQKIHWPGLEMLHLFKVESDWRHCKIWDKVISKWLMSTPCPCWCSAQESMFMRFTPSLHRSCCAICCCSLTHLIHGTWRWWPAAKPVSSFRTAIVGSRECGTFLWLGTWRNISARN